MNTDFKRFGIFALTLLCSVALKANDNSEYFTNNSDYKFAQPEEQPLRVAAKQPQYMSKKAMDTVTTPVSFNANKMAADFELPTVSFESNSWDNANSYPNDLVKGLMRSEDATHLHPVQYEQNFFTVDSLTPMNKEEEQVSKALKYDLLDVMYNEHETTKPTKSITPEEQAYKVLKYDLLDVMRNEDETTKPTKSITPEEQAYKVLNDLLDVTRNEDETIVAQKQEVTSLFQKAMNGCQPSFDALKNFWAQGNKQKAICIAAGTAVAGVAGYVAYKLFQKVMASETVIAAQEALNEFQAKHYKNMPVYAGVTGSVAAIVAYEALTSGLIKNNLKVGLPVAAGAALAVYGLNKCGLMSKKYTDFLGNTYKSLPSTCAALGAGATALAYELALRNSNNSTPGKMVANMLIKPAANKVVATFNTYATKENAIAAANYLKETASNSYNAAATKISSWLNKAPQVADVAPESKSILEKASSFFNAQHWKQFGGWGF